MTSRPTISLFRKPANRPPAPERNSVAEFSSLDDALRFLADQFGSRWRWQSIRSPEPREAK
jgi:hypothetical protein